MQKSFNCLNVDLPQRLICVVFCIASRDNIGWLYSVIKSAKLVLMPFGHC